VAYAEINKPARNLAAYRAGLSDRSWPRADLALRPISNSSGTHRRVRLQLAFRNLRHLALAAKFLDPGSDRGEVVSSTGTAHGVSSLLRCGLRLIEQLRNKVNTIWAEPGSGGNGPAQRNPGGGDAGVSERTISPGDEMIALSGSTNTEQRRFPAEVRHAGPRPRPDRPHGLSNL
jgi:hypothetical protein